MNPRIVESASNAELGGWSESEPIETEGAEGVDPTGDAQVQLIPVEEEETENETSAATDEANDDTGEASEPNEASEPAPMEAPTPICGDGLCELTETTGTCAVDCGADCGDGVCNGGEGTVECPEDCGTFCGDTVCHESESSANCPNDCDTQCGDDVCNGKESSASCFQDCGTSCGDGECNGAENGAGCAQDCESQCNDGVCNGDETSASCHEDCGAACGDGICNGGEGSDDCAKDCGAVCGDLVCNGNEGSTQCPDDCGASCGDGACNGAESPAQCPADCGSNCGDAICNGDESSTNCSLDCGSSCGDGACNGDEASDSCVVDCGAQCGDAVCNGDESNAGCPNDCPAQCGNTVCESDESTVSCETDCGSSCGDSACNGMETTAQCAEDCGTSCGDFICNGDENSANCSDDCGSSCGDGQCNGLESTGSCATDCGASCGDGMCNGEETSALCVADCGATCDDGVCNGSENSANCVPDCGSVCGDGTCNGYEKSAGCVIDCGSTCGDAICNGGENSTDCVADCGTVCGDSVCNGVETSANCQNDCGAVCGDSACNGNESSTNCVSDCGTVCGDGVCNGGEGNGDCYSDCVGVEEASIQTLGGGNQGSDCNLPPLSAPSVGIQNNSLVDDSGPYLGLGATLFWAAWGYKNDQGKLKANLQFLADNGFNYIRALGVVGCVNPPDPDDHSNYWAGREIKVSWSDYDQVIAGLTDLAYDQYGLRIEWTLIGDGQCTVPTTADKYNLIDRFLSMSEGREQKIVHFEIANEAWQNGFSGDSGLEELREMSAYMRANTDILVAASAPPNATCEEMQAINSGCVSDIAPSHFDRNIAMIEGSWRPVRQPWHHQHCPLPPGSNNEPIGPGASVNTEHSAIKLVSGAYISYISGLPLHVYHTNAGVRGDQNIMDMSGASAFANIHELMPPDASSWKQVNAHWSDAPLRVYSGDSNGTLHADTMWVDHGPGASSGTVRAYGIVRGNNFIVYPMGIRNSATMEARRRMDLSVIDPITGVTKECHSLVEGAQFTLSGAEALLIKGVYWCGGKPCSAFSCSVGEAQTTCGDCGPGFKCQSGECTCGPSPHYQVDADTGACLPSCGALKNKMDWADNVCSPVPCAGAGGDTFDCAYCCEVGGDTCVPETCASLGASCGKHDNGCFGELDCGGCAGAQTCDQGQCQAPECGEMPHYKVIPETGLCLPSCGQLRNVMGWEQGQCSTTPCSGAGGESFDCAYCCEVAQESDETCQTETCEDEGEGEGDGEDDEEETPPVDCGPYPHFQMKNGACLGSCGQVGNDNGWYSAQCSATICNGTGAPSHDCNYCCEVLEPEPECVPTSCSQLGASCGNPDDGCGGTLNCGNCKSYESCDAGQCVAPECGPSPHYGLDTNTGQCLPSCGQARSDNGWYAAKCSNNGCDGAGVPSFDCNICCEVQEPEPVCVPKTCGQLGANCGSPSDGCGGTLNCGSCEEENDTNPPIECGPYPHFQVKNGECLPSCGHLGNLKGWAGAKLQGSPCSGNSGASHEPGYCCEIPGAPSQSEPSSSGAKLSSGDQADLRSAKFGKYCAAESGDNHHLNCNRDATGSWEAYSVVKIGGSGTINSGDTIALRSMGWDKYCAAEDFDGNVLHCNRDSAGSWEQFVITKTSGSGAIHFGDSVSLRSTAWNRYCSAGDGGNHKVHCNAGNAGDNETFQFMD